MEHSVQDSPRLTPLRLPPGPQGIAVGSLTVAIATTGSRTATAALLLSNHIAYSISGVAMATNFPFTKS